LIPGHSFATHLVDVRDALVVITGKTIDLTKQNYREGKSREVGSWTRSYPRLRAELHPYPKLISE